MSNRTQTWNAFETTLAATLNPGILFVDLTSVTNLSFPVYVTLDPEKAAKLEYLKIINIVGTTVEFEQRNLDGSAGDGTHDPGAILRLTWTKQLQDDIFNDIETLEAADAALTAADAAHVAAGDPHTQYASDTSVAAAVDAHEVAGDHAQYVEKGGDTMTGELALPAGDPSGTTIAAHKAYVDAQIAGGGLPAGTRMIFDQSTAPAGWVRDTTTVDDRMIRIVTGARDPNGGTWTQPSHAHGNPSANAGGGHNHAQATHTHPIGAHTHDIDPHDHTTPNTGVAIGTATALEDAGTSFSYAIGSHTHSMGNTGSDDPFTTAGGSTPNTSASAAVNTGSEANHSHTIGDTDGAGMDAGWRPAYRDMIIAVKS